MRGISFFAAFLVLLMALAACGKPALVGNAENGKKIYYGDVVLQGSRGELFACIRCHPVNPGEKPNYPVGVNMAHIALRAGVTVKDKTAEEYLRESILNPDAFLAGNFQDGLMSREYAKALTPQQVEDLVAYLMTLK
ncbi:MAG TPA: c-type cytochrome [Thermoflexales bacterium]|nr:c-type cytochrome [Thermoflexales bacterium]